MLLEDYANKMDAFVYDENNDDKENSVWWQLQLRDLFDRVEVTFRNIEKEILNLYEIKSKT